MKFSLPTLSFECENKAGIDDISDDLKREEAFTRQALETVVAARKIIIAAKIPFSRPEGYFCEMIKTEEHMSNISKKKAEEKASMKAAEDARKQRLNRKFGKKVQTEREQEKKQRQSEEMKKLNKLRKRPQRPDDDFDIEVEHELEGSHDRLAPSKRTKFGEKQVSKKRQIRNEKYGFGGRKRGLKQNTKESSEKDEFDGVRNRRPFRGIKQGGKKGDRKQRPGKMRRQQMRSRKLNAKK